MNLKAAAEMPFFYSLFSPKKMPEKLGKIDIKTPRKWRNLKIEGGKLYKKILIRDHFQMPNFS
jgi:hypothetical protein